MDIAGDVLLVFQTAEGGGHAEQAEYVHRTPIRGGYQVAGRYHGEHQRVEQKVVDSGEASFHGRLSRQRPRWWIHEPPQQSKRQHEKKQHADTAMDVRCLLVPLVAVKSVPERSLTPLRYTSTNPTSYIALNVV